LDDTMSESKLIDRLNKLPPCETPHYAIALNPLLKRPELLAAIARACGGAAANLRSSKAREVAQAAGVPRGLHVRLGERCFDSVMATFLLWNDCDAARGYEPDHVCLSYEAGKDGSKARYALSHCHAIYATLREAWPKARIIWYGHEWRHNYHGHARKSVYPDDIPRDDRTLDLYGADLHADRVAIDVNEEAAKREAWMHARDVINGKGDPVAPVPGWQPWVSVLGMDWHRSGLEGKHFTFNHNVHIYDRHLYHRAELVRKMNPSAVWLYYHDDHDLDAWVDGLIRYLCGWHGLGKLI
jgi:hypothetical protein